MFLPYSPLKDPDWQLASIVLALANRHGKALTQDPGLLKYVDARDHEGCKRAPTPPIQPT